MVEKASLMPVVRERRECVSALLKSTEQRWDVGRCSRCAKCQSLSVQITLKKKIHIKHSFCNPFLPVETNNSAKPSVIVYICGFLPERAGWWLHEEQLFCSSCVRKKRQKKLQRNSDIHTNGRLTGKLIQLVCQVRGQNWQCGQRPFNGNRNSKH